MNPALKRIARINGLLTEDNRKINDPMVVMPRVLAAVNELTTAAMLTVLRAGLYQLQIRLLADDNGKTRQMARTVLAVRGELDIIARDIQS
jgi:hypothetical protein